MIGIDHGLSRPSASSSRRCRESVLSVLARRLRPRANAVSAGSATCAATPAAASSPATYRQPVHPSTANATPAAERDAHMAVHRLRLTEDLAHLTALAERDKPEEVAWSRISRSSIRVSQDQLAQFGSDFEALVARYALAEKAPDGEPTALVQLRLYAFPASES